MSLRIYGVRHHGPGCARSVVDALEAQPPAAILVEGPPDADALVALAGQTTLVPPVAILVHREDNARQAVFYPFAEFSPEWQTLRWAVTHGVPVKFMDFPWQHRFALAQPEPSAVDGPSAESPSSTPMPTPEDHPATGDIGGGATVDLALQRDPLRVLAEADGYQDSERWWNDRVEERGDAAGMFAAILEAITVVRTELALPETLQERRREAWMRRVIRETQRETLGDVVVVCGAWHAPALVNPPKVSGDNELLKALPKCKVGVTWVPWTYQRLCTASGYGAGIESPGWYEHLWQFRRDPQLTARWFTRVGRLLRGRDLDASTAQVIDSVRLAEHLAAFRGRAIPGLAEMNEASIAVFCQGDPAPLRWVSSELIVGQRLGLVPEGAARVPLQQDIEATQRRLRLKPSSAQSLLELDLREATGLERSRFLHRLALLELHWGRKESVAGKGTFKEVWKLEWKPEFAIATIDAARFGNTVETAASGAVLSSAAGASLPELCELLEQALLSELPAVTATLLRRISDEAAQGDDVLRLCRAVPALARLARYGSVRQTDAIAVVTILDGLHARIQVGLRGAIGGIDEEAAAAWREAMAAYQGALQLLESPWLESWRGLLGGFADGAVIPALLAGTSARLLLDLGSLQAGDTARWLSLALSRGQDPSHAAAWLEGFLANQGSVLVHDEHLLPLMEGWVGGLTDEAFLMVLPLVRRTFATFTSPERGRIAARLGQGRITDRTPAAPVWDLHPERAAAVLPTVLRLLGKADRVGEAP